MKAAIRVGVLLSSFLFIWSCKDKTEALPNANFTFHSNSISEGDTLIFINTSTNASTNNWSSNYKNWSSNNQNPQIVMDSAGNYQFKLTVSNGDGKTHEKALNVSVKPDTIFRLSNNSRKVWYVNSIMYNGNEILNQSCQKDDEFTVYRNGIKDTCNITEGKDTCPDGTYIFELPATSDWRFNSKTQTFDFALTAFGSPINLNFAANKCSKDTFEGIDIINGVSIRLIRKK